MHDLSTVRRLNTEAASRELERQQMLIARLESRFRQRGIEIDLGTTIQSATEAIRLRLQKR